MPQNTAPPTQRSTQPTSPLHWAAKRPWRLLGATALLTVVLAAVGAMASTGLSAGGFTPTGTESSRVERLLTQHFGVPQSDLLLYVRGDIDDPVAATEGRDLTRRLAAEPGVASAQSFWSTGAGELRARDGHAALITIDLSGDDTQAAAAAARIVPHATKSVMHLEVSAGGPAWTSVQATDQSRKDLFRAELIAAPLTILILLFAFGSATAAVLPAVVGVATVTLTTAVLGLLTRVMAVSVFATNITTALGFGLAVDYALLVVTRFREELAAGATVTEAVVTTMRTAGRSVLFSAATVALALCCLFVFPLQFLRSMACAGLAVVVLSALATVTVMPALLTLLGNRIAGATNRPKPSREPTDSAAWRHIAQAAVTRPLLLGGACAAALIALTIPFGHVQFGIPDERALPAHLEAHATGEYVRRDFPAPADRTLAVLLPATDPLTQATELSRYAQRLADVPGVATVEAATGTFSPGAPSIAPAAGHRRFTAPGTTWLTVSGRPSLDTAGADDLVQRVRHVTAPGPRLVGGLPAQHVDTLTALGDRLPAATAIAGFSTLLLLFLFTRSVLIPLKALLLAALSLTACLGIMVFIFQEGHLHSLVGEFTVTGQLDVAMPLLTIVVAFGLSVDYEVFLLARIKEEYLRTGAHSPSIVFGIARTGRLVTAAALIVATMMGALASSGVTPLKIFGTGLALAVLIDATLVRGVLVPCLMQLTGKANWWAPSFLSRREATDGSLPKRSESPLPHQHPAGDPANTPSP
ncbi:MULTISPECIES: MMPL family transporter [unclassified Streptomyces]|uniref:MMPL family transporter n=1 Tax=unclassified Streptomyces TaxID=2593676 RepID=UPI002E3200F6|nr:MULTISPECIES: MMPL family transporter [unclassified Streptomyces]WUC68430.1 MMPL family transporter [Streptomyces sp. NBC_00539]